MEVPTRKFKETAPEAVVILGNDQREFFDEGLTPSITVYRGAQVRNIQHTPANAPVGINIAEPGNAPSDGASYPGAPALADHILDSLAAENFDLAQSDQTPTAAPRGGIPHAYGFLYHSILGDTPPPSVPIILNVHFPHNVPKNRRCLDLGAALTRAIKSFTGFQRVALMASGGLSHFVVDEELDRKILAAMETGDEAALEAVRKRLQGRHRGNKELVSGDRRDEPDRAALPPCRLRPVLPDRSRHRQWHGLRVLGLAAHAGRSEEPAPHGSRPRHRWASCYAVTGCPSPR